MNMCDVLSPPRVDDNKRNQVLSPMLKKHFTKQLQVTKSHNLRDGGTAKDLSNVAVRFNESSDAIDDRMKVEDQVTDVR